MGVEELHLFGIRISWFIPQNPSNVTMICRERERETLDSTGALVGVLLVHSDSAVFFHLVQRKASPGHPLVILKRKCLVYLDERLVKHHMFWKNQLAGKKRPCKVLK